MAYTIETRTVDGTAIFGFSPPALQGYWDGLTGAYDNIDQKASVVYEGSDWAAILWANNDDELLLEVEGWVGNATTDDLKGWDKIVINGTSFNRSAANTFSTLYSSSSSTYKIRTRWIWTGVSTSPFPNSTGVTVTWQHNGYAPTQGSISLNQIHQEAGGSSGTSVTINDADVRGKSWYGRLTTTPASGATQDFADFYYPRLMAGEHSGTTYPTRIWASGQSTTYGTSNRSGRCDARWIRQVHGGWNPPQRHAVIIGAAVQADGTDTIIYMALGAYNTGTTTRKYVSYGDTEYTASSLLTEVYRIPGVSADEVAMYSVSTLNGVDTSNGFYYQNEDPTTTSNFNQGPTWTGAAYLSTNSTTSFTSLSNTSYRYGRQFRALHITSDAEILSSYFAAHFRIILRKAPTSSAGYWTRDIGLNLRGDLYTDTTP